jgi:hypothetical protein
LGAGELAKSFPTFLPSSMVQDLREHEPGREKWWRCEVK